MIRERENSLAWRAGLMSLLVHGLLLGVLVLSVNWKSVQPMSVAEVELWDALPSPSVEPQPTPKPVEPKPIEPKPIEPKPIEPKPIVEPKPEPKPVEEPKADIQVKKEPPKLEKPLPKPLEPPKPDMKKELEKLQQQEMLKKLQQELLAEDSKPHKEAHQQPGVTGANASQASKGEIDKYIGLISAKIRQNVNKELCGNGNPELQFSISLLLTGEVIGSPRLIKGSGSQICDEAVERAILLSQPMPVPTQPDLFSQFRELKLKFRPNDGN